MTDIAMSHQSGFRPGLARRRIVNAAKYAFLILFGFFSIFPLYFMAVSATNTSQNVLASRMIPGSAFLTNLKNLMDAQDLGEAFFMSGLIAVVTTVLCLIVTAIAGYGFEIYHSKGKDRVMSILLLAMMVPFAATMIPLFQMFVAVGLPNSWWAVILPSVSTPFMIMLFRQSSRSFPHEILEAARLDGLNEVMIFFRIFIPTMRSTFAAAAVITFMAAWNNFMWPKVILGSSGTVTMPIITSNLVAGYTTDYGVLMLTVLIASLPTMVIFLVLQRAFANGITGAVK